MHTAGSRAGATSAESDVRLHPTPPSTTTPGLDLQRGTCADASGRSPWWRSGGAPWRGSPIRGVTAQAVLTDNGVRLPQRRTSPAPASPPASATAARAPTGPRPTARSSASTARCSRNGLTFASTAPRQARTAALARWLHHYNHHRGHTALERSTSGQPCYGDAPDDSTARGCLPRDVVRLLRELTSLVFTAGTRAMGCSGIARTSASRCRQAVPRATQRVGRLGGPPAHLLSDSWGFTPTPPLGGSRLRAERTSVPAGGVWGGAPQIRRVQRVGLLGTPGACRCVSARSIRHVCSTSSSRCRVPCTHISVLNAHFPR